MSRWPSRFLGVSAMAGLAAITLSGPVLADEKLNCSKPPGAEKYVCEIVVDKGGSNGGPEGDGSEGAPPDPDEVMRAEYCAWILNEGNEVVPDFCNVVGAPTPDEIAKQLWPLEPPKPEVRTAPPTGSDAAVGVPVWTWVDEAQWAPIKKRKAIGAVWAEVVATPTSISINPGDGRTITCPGPGTAYKKGRKSACTFRYLKSSAGQPGSAYSMTVSVTWEGSWTGSGGVGGALPNLTASSTVPIRVAEGQALN